MAKYYFKITNSQERHDNFSYRDGLNIFDDDFPEEGNSRGLFFSDAEHVLKFKEMGCYLRDVILPTNKEFKMVEHTKENNKWRANMLILGDRRELADINTFSYLLSKGAHKEDILLEILNVTQPYLPNYIFEVIKAFGGDYDIENDPELFVADVKKLMDLYENKDANGIYIFLESKNVNTQEMIMFFDEYFFKCSIPEFCKIYNNSEEEMHQNLKKYVNLYHNKDVRGMFSFLRDKGICVESAKEMIFKYFGDCDNFDSFCNFLSMLDALV